MKNAFKFLGALLIGMAIGLLIGYLIGWAMKGITPGEFIDKLVKINALEIGGVVLASISFMFLAAFLHIILHEGGHLVCGLLTGYRFVSFRILSWTLIRQEGKFRIKRFGIAGTGGQCLLTPPELPTEEIPVTLYNMGGVLINALTAALALILLLTLDDLTFLPSLALMLFCFVGFALALLNGLPLKSLGINNDGSNMLLLKKDNRAKEALAIQLRANALVQAGVRPKDMPAEWFEVKEVDFSDALQYTIFLMRSARQMDLLQWEEAWQTLKEADAHRNELIPLYVKEQDCELLFTALITGRMEEAEKYLTPELTTYINQYRKLMSSKERVLCAIALYRENDADKAQAIYDSLLQRKAQYLMQGEVEMDLALMKHLLENASKTSSEA